MDHNDKNRINATNALVLQTTRNHIETRKLPNLRPNWNNYRSVEGKMAPPRLFMLVQQPVKHSKKLHHPLITACTWGQRSLHQKVFLGAVIAHQSEPPMAAAVAPNNRDIRSNPVQLHRMVRGYLLRDKSRERQSFGFSLQSPVTCFVSLEPIQNPMPDLKQSKNYLIIKILTRDFNI